MVLKVMSLGYSAALVLCLLACFQRTAHAYVDPGSGLLVYQSASVLLTGALFYLRKRVRRLFRKSSDQD